jgi:hypothetical protein
MMFCLGATVGRRIGDPYLMCYLAAKSADLMLVNLPHSINRDHAVRRLHGPLLCVSDPFPLCATSYQFLFSTKDALL